MGADDLDDEQMQRIASWTNLSETTFVLEATVPQPAYRLRIFTPQHELPFAGHPTIGSCHAVLEAGILAPKDSRLVQECGAGNLPLRIQGEGPERRIWVEAPEAKFVAEYDEMWKACEDALGKNVARTSIPAAFNNGPTWLFVRFEQAAEVAALEPDMPAVAKLSREKHVGGIAAFAFTHRGEDEPAVHIRCFAPAFGIPEDPVTGSANAALPAHLARYGMLTEARMSYVATQGTELGRDGRVHVRVHDGSGRAEIGGQAVTVVEGEIRV